MVADSMQKVNQYINKFNVSIDFLEHYRMAM